jgi:hypothetical protein
MLLQHFAIAKHAVALANPVAPVADSPSNTTVRYNRFLHYTGSAPIVSLTASHDSMKPTIAILTALSVEYETVWSVLDTDAAFAAQLGAGLTGKSDAAPDRASDIIVSDSEVSVRKDSDWKSAVYHPRHRKSER